MSRSRSYAEKISKMQEKSLPVSFIIEELKEKRHFRLLARKLIFFISYFIVYLMILAMQRDVNSGFLMHETVHNEITRTFTSDGVSFDEILTTQDYWDWLQGTLVPSVYKAKWYNGDDLEPEWEHTIGTHTKLVGGFRMLQTRRVNHEASICYDTVFDDFTHTCLSNSNSEEDDRFGNRTKIQQSILTKYLTMFDYSIDDEGIAGYQARFNWSTTRGVTERSILTEMYALRWIDHFTKTVTVDLTLYNNNLKLWSSVRLNVFFNLAGGVETRQTTTTMNVEPYNLENGYFMVRMVLEIIHASLVGYFLVIELYDVFVLSGGNLYLYSEKYGLWNNIGDFMHIVTNIFILLRWVDFINHPVREKLLTTSDFSSFIDILPLADWEDRYMSLNTLNVLFQTLRSLKYFQITGGGLRLIKSLFLAAPEVLGFLPIFITVLAGYTFAGHFLYGLTNREWSTWDGAFFRVYEINFGLYDPNEIYDSGGVLSAFFIYTGTVIICVVMLNVFLAIVMTTWDSLSDDAKALDEREDLEIPKLTFHQSMKLVWIPEAKIDTVIEIAQRMKGEMIAPDEFKEHFKPYGVISYDLIKTVASWFWISKEVKRKRFSSGFQRKVKVMTAIYEPGELEPPPVKPAPVDEDPLPDNQPMENPPLAKRKSSDDIKMVDF